MRRAFNVVDMPVCVVMCKTCPFGTDGDLGLRNSVTSRLLSVSQTCHSTGVAIGKRRDTHICRGARDWQLTIMHRLGVISAPTDAEWAAKWNERKQAKL